MKLASTNSKITARIGHALAQEIAHSSSSHAVVIALAGDLGAGKTTFVQGFMKGLGVRSRIQSPTFVVMKKFSISKKISKQFRYAYHIDAYRLTRARELNILGFDDVLADRKNIILLEWPERVKKLLPVHYILVDLRHRKVKNDRMLTIQEIKK